MSLRDTLQQNYSCPVELALDVIGGRWRALILAFLKESPRRYSELGRLAPGMSDKMLSQRLRELCDAELVVKITENEHHHYALGPRGETLRPVLEAMYQWGLAVAEELDISVAAARS